jgi:NitT/TauT family transport system permease protein
MADTIALETSGQSEPRWRIIWRNALPFLVVGALWELVARLGLFPPRLFPSLETIAAAFWRLTLNGVLPLFLLWFGLGNTSAVLLVAFVSAFPIIFNTWTGVKAVKEIWVRSAQAMGADDPRLFRHVILPGALPYILTGLRLGLAQAWRILVGVEMLAAVPWGLGWMIFGAREFLNMDVMLAGVAVIAIIGLALEKLVFQRLEEFTVVRWGMMT